jgi:hypothetical protein
MLPVLSGLFSWEVVLPQALTLPTYHGIYDLASLDETLFMVGGVDASGLYSNCRMRYGSTGATMSDWADTAATEGRGGLRTP